MGLWISQVLPTSPEVVSYGIMLIIKRISLMDCDYSIAIFQHQVYDLEFRNTSTMIIQEFHLCK